MRFIEKKSYAGYGLEKAHENSPQTAQQARSRWHSFAYKSDLSHVLKQEQYGLCAYSELKTEAQGLGTHIEHIEPKSLNPQRTFDYNNLVLCALSHEDLATQPDSAIFGGHAKQSDYDETLFVSCLQSDCSRYFVYLSTGYVIAAESLSENEKQQANYTINLLNLNCAYLVNLRKRWIDEVDTLIDEHIEKGYSLDDLAAIYLQPTSGSLDPFFSATCQRFRL